MFDQKHLPRVIQIQIGLLDLVWRSSTLLLDHVERLSNSSFNAAKTALSTVSTPALSADQAA